MPNQIFKRCGHFCGDFICGFVDSVRSSNVEPAIPISEQIPISGSEKGKKAISEALSCETFIDILYKVCRREHLSKEGCVQAAYWCCKALRKGAYKAFHDAYFNLIYYFFYFKLK
jgi:hypothetical protein